MVATLLRLRARFHPLYHLRGTRPFQWLAYRWDFPIRIRTALISHPVFVSLFKNFSYIVSSGITGEELECANFVDLIKAGDFRSFFDVGANVGMYGFIFRSVVRNGHVTMFEPDEDNAALIQRTIKSGKVQGVDLIIGAVCETECKVTFHKDDLSGATGSISRSGRDSFLSVHHNVPPRDVTVQGIPLDSLTGEPPDLIKIDIEGAELSALRGAKKLIERHSPALFLECDEDQRDVAQFLVDRGYAFFDFRSLQAVDFLPHNSLALHQVKHAHVIDRIRGVKIDAAAL